MPPTRQPRDPFASQSDEQKQLHKLDAFNLAIGLKRAIYDAGYTCKRVTDAGFVGTYKNLDEWMARCPGPRLGDLRRPGRKRAGTRLQGPARIGPAAVRDQGAAGGQVRQPEIGRRAALLRSRRTGGFPCTRQSPSVP